MEWILHNREIVLVLLAWLALRVWRVMRERDVDYSRAMAEDMQRREQQAPSPSSVSWPGRRRATAPPASARRSRT